MIGGNVSGKVMNLLLGAHFIGRKFLIPFSFFFLGSVHSVEISLEKKSVLDFADGPQPDLHF